MSKCHFSNTLTSVLSVLLKEKLQLLLGWLPWGTLRHALMITISQKLHVLDYIVTVHNLTFVHHFKSSALSLCLCKSLAFLSPHVMNWRQCTILRRNYDLMMYMYYALVYASVLSGSFFLCSVALKIEKAVACVDCRALLCSLGFEVTLFDAFLPL